MENKLIALEAQYGGYDNNVPRRKISASDPRGQAALTRPGGMIGGDRMSPQHHYYAPAYAQYLTPKVSDRPLVLVEIGVLRGVGLAIWADLLPSGSRIIGLDIDLSHFNDNRSVLESLGAFQKNTVEVYEWDQFSNTSDDLEVIVSGERVDIVIDDGCHFDDAISRTITAMCPYLADGFVYFIEDNKRYCGIFKQTMMGLVKGFFPRLMVDKHGELTVLKDGGLAEWVKKYIGYLPDFEHPRSFNEKINWKKLHDRNPLLPVTADKYAVRRYVKNVLGTTDILKPLLHVTDDPESIPFDVLPADYVIKPNHMSGCNIFVRDGQADQRDIVTKCRKWLNEKYAPYAMEWAYEPIKPMILIEMMVPSTPDSYKLHVFHGKCELIQLSRGSIEDKHRLTFTLYDLDWHKLDVRYVHDSADPIPRPGFLDKMISYAERLAAPFDYVRIDFCIGPGDHIYFEEVTHYPVSGHASIRPVAFDYDLGAKWHIRENYWLTDWPERTAPWT